MKTRPPLRQSPGAGAWAGLLRWSFIRHKYLIPAFTAVQALFAVAIVVGFSLALPEVDTTAAVYLSSGAWTLGIVAVGCVLAPQIVSSSKQDGLLEFHRTLPVPRIEILISDIVVWGFTAIPGIIAGIVTAMLRFNVRPSLGLPTLGTLLLALVMTTSLGICIAYWLPPNVSSLVTQVIIMGGLLFSPILFPSERLPEWAVALHQLLPIAPIGDLIRAAAFQTRENQTLNLLVVVCWTVGAFCLAYFALTRRK